MVVSCLNSLLRKHLDTYNSQALVARNNPPFFVNWFESQLNSKDFFLLALFQYCSVENRKVFGQFVIVFETIFILWICTGFKLINVEFLLSLSFSFDPYCTPLCFKYSFFDIIYDFAPQLCWTVNSSSFRLSATIGEGFSSDT